jgi:hypothetical protein
MTKAHAKTMTIGEGGLALAMTAGAFVRIWPCLAGGGLIQIKAVIAR